MTDNTQHIVTISKTDLAVLPVAAFHGNIIVVDSPEQVDDAIAVLRAADIIGFDTETRPSFKKGQTYSVSLLQLSTHDTCFLFRINKIGVPESLKALLEDEDKLKIGLSLHDDFHNMHKLCEFTPAGFVDLQPFVKDYMIADNSLARIYGILFSQRISKGQRLTNWEAKNLTKCQQAYAALDAQACIEIYQYLMSGQFDPWTSPYLQEIEPQPIEE
ncbi:MAG: 3'-5' exonuclease domain-containing protein 2 [Muribaculaceae bacterium]|nr:3'-5' exonuclease domain-containing protein 2 [Muribaculaceae bacterium]